MLIDPILVLHMDTRNADHLFRLKIENKVLLITPEPGGTTENQFLVCLQMVVLAWPGLSR